MTDTKIFLDLEGTVINNWNNAELINIQTVCQYLRRKKATEVSIFSFAIWDEEDKKRFETQMKDMLELALEVKIVEWLSVDEVIGLTSNKNETMDPTPRHEFMRAHSKGEAFFKLCRRREEKVACFLVDDAVDDEMLFLPNRNLIVCLTPVQDLIKR